MIIEGLPIALRVMNCPPIGVRCGRVGEEIIQNHLDTGQRGTIPRESASYFVEL